MQRVRGLLARHPAVLVALLLCTLLLRGLVPAGFMPSVADGRVGLVMCAGTMPVTPDAHTGNATAGHHGPRDDHPQPEQPCAYAGIQLPALASAVVVVPLLAMPLARDPPAALGRTPAPAQQSHLRPPLRGPPAVA